MALNKSKITRALWEIRQRAGIRKSAKLLTDAFGAVATSDLVTNDGTAFPAAGKLGEVVFANRSRASTLALTNNTPANVTSVSLTPGVWIIQGFVGFKFAATTSITFLAGGISNVSGTINNDLGRFSFATPAMVPVNDISWAVNGEVYNITTTTTFFLITSALFTVSTCAAWGDITAIRIA